MPSSINTIQMRSSNGHCKTVSAGLAWRCYRLAKPKSIRCKMACVAPSSWKVSYVFKGISWPVVVRTRRSPKNT